MFQAFQAVKVANQEHPRDGQAGVVVDTKNQAGADDAPAVLVRFDLDQVVEAVPSADLTVLL